MTASTFRPDEFASEVRLATARVADWSEAMMSPWEKLEGGNGDERRRRGRGQEAERTD